MFSKDHGQSLTELALILPFLFLFLAIALDVGRAMMVYMEVVHAAREGAWVASQPGGSVVRAHRAVSNALREAGLDPSQARVRVIIRPSGAPVEVHIRYTYTPLLPLLPVRALPIRVREVAVRW